MKSKTTFKLNLVFLQIFVLAITTILILPLPAQTINRDKFRPNNQNAAKVSYIPLDHYWSSERSDNYSTANQSAKKLALNTKYRFVRKDGYILKEASNVEGQAVPLYVYYSSTRKDHFTTASPQGIRAAEAGGYRRVRTDGYVMRTVKPAYRHLYKPLWLYYHDKRKDNFTIATPEGIRVAEAGGYRKVRIEGYVSITNRNSAPIIDVAVDSYRNHFQMKNPPRTTAAALQKWNRTVTKMQGIEGFDPVGNMINYPPAEKTYWNFSAGQNNWIPLSYEKQVCCGRLENFKTYDGKGDEMDWNFFILPSDEFSFLITKALPYKEETTLMSSGGWHKNDRGQYQMEAEITPDQSLYKNNFFPKKGSGKVGDPDISLEGKQVCFYGPWVREWFHHHRPEIHPSEMIWWRTSNGYYMMLLQDDSNRFDDKTDFDTGGGLLPSSWKPWAEPPLTAQFKIAFEVKPSASGLPQKMEIEEVYKRFVVTKNDAQASADADNGSSHALVVDNKILLVVNEKQANDQDLGVKFVDISRRVDGTIQGYVQITTKVGGPDLGGEEGYHMLHVTSSSMPVVKTVRDHRKE